MGTFLQISEQVQLRDLEAVMDVRAHLIQSLNFTEEKTWTRGG